MIVSQFTHIGNVRAENQDRIYVSDGFPILACVFDGMGGHFGGAYAAGSALSYMLQNAGNLDELSGEKISRLLTEVSEILVKEAARDKQKTGMGTTAAVALIKENLLIAVNIGDSRIYVKNKTGIKQITKDHSYVQMLLDQNYITREEIANHPYRNVITRAIGMEQVNADVFSEPLETDDIVILCSDGLYNYLPADEISEIASEDTAAEKMGKLALVRGGSDNISIIVVKYGERYE